MWVRCGCSELCYLVVLGGLRGWVCGVVLIRNWCYDWTRVVLVELVRFFGCFVVLVVCLL